MSRDRGGGRDTGRDRLCRRGCAHLGLGVAAASSRNTLPAHGTPRRALSGFSCPSLSCSAHDTPRPGSAHDTPRPRLHPSPPLPAPTAPRLTHAARLPCAEAPPSRAARRRRDAPPHPPNRKRRRRRGRRVMSLRAEPLVVKPTHSGPHGPGGGQRAVPPRLEGRRGGGEGWNEAHVRDRGLEPAPARGTRCDVSRGTRCGVSRGTRCDVSRGTGAAGPKSQGPMGLAAGQRGHCGLRIQAPARRG